MQPTASIDGEIDSMARQKVQKASAAKCPKHAAYTGSPDSEVIAGYVEHFTYDSSRTEEVRKKYAAILKE